MRRLEIPHDRIAKRLGAIQRTISSYLAKMPGSALWPKADLSKGIALSGVAEKHGGSLRSLLPYVYKKKGENI